MAKKTIRLTEEDLSSIVEETVKRIVKEADRHRPGYWKERWQKQKAKKEAEKASVSGQTGETDKAEPDKKPKTKKPKKKDRHRPGYYREYNKKHPERLNRGYTKGYNNGNVSDGRVQPNGVGLEIGPGVYIIGYDELGLPVTNNPFGDLLRNREMQWHDDDWCEDCD